MNLHSTASKKNRLPLFNSQSQPLYVSDREMAVYTNNNLEFIHTPEGYMEPTDDGFQYVYRITDHLGNVRVTFKKDTATNSVTVLETNDYYPFGLQHQKAKPVLGSTNLGQNYKFAGKEFEDDLGKNTVAYEWRDYDPAIARFNKVDRFAEKYESITPYNFAANSPMIYKEIQGDSLVAITVAGLNRKNPTVQNRNFLVDETIAENIVGFVNTAREKFNHLTVNNIFRSVSSSEIETSNTKSKGTSRHEAGFAIDLNGIGKLNDNELSELNQIASEFGLSPLKNQKNDLPHFSINPTSQGYSSLSESVNENKGHFNELVNSSKSGGIRTSSLKDKEGNIIGVRFERGTNSAQSQQKFNQLIKELISNAQ